MILDVLPWSDNKSKITTEGGVQLIALRSANSRGRHPSRMVAP
jgi:hypothetical protein